MERREIKKWKREKKNHQKQGTCDGGSYIDVWGPYCNRFKPDFLCKEDDLLLARDGADDQHTNEKRGWSHTLF